MRWISSREDFEKHKKMLFSLMDASKALPQKIFLKNLEYFSFITFYEVLSPSVFNKLKEFSKRSDSSGFWIMVLDPDPETYFFNNFGCYSLLLFEDSDVEKTFVSALNNFPKDSPADAIMYNSNSLAISSARQEWIIYVDRELDIGICAFATEDLKNQFSSIYGERFLGDVVAAANYVYSAGDAALRDQFKKNFADRK